MQMYANEGTLAEHLRKVSIPSPCCPHGRFWNSAPVPVPEDCAAVSTTRGRAEPRSLSCREERGRGSRPALATLLSPQHPQPFGVPVSRNAFCSPAAKKGAAGEGRAREPAAIAAPGERGGSGDGGRRGRARVRQSSSEAELPERNCGCRGRGEPHEQPRGCRGLRDAGICCPEAAQSPGERGRRLESSSNREGLRTQGALAPEFRPGMGGAAGFGECVRHASHTNFHQKSGRILPNLLWWLHPSQG